MKNNFLNYCKKEKKPIVVAVVLLVFLIGFFLLIPGEGPSESAKSIENPYSEESRLDTSERIQALSKDILENHSDNIIFILVSLLISLVLILGVLLNIFLYLGRKSIPGFIRLNFIREVKWSVIDVVIVFLLMFVLEVAISLLLNVLLIKTGVAANVNAIIMTSTLLRSIAILIIICFVVKFKYNSELSNIGLHFNNWPKQLFIGAAAYIALLPIYMGVLVVISQIIQWFQYQVPVQTPVQILYQEKNIQLLFYFSLFMGIVGPFFEEILFRGYLYQALKKHMSVVTSMLVTSVLFSLLHMHLIAFIPIFILAVVLNILFEKTGSILPGAIMHSIHNTLMLLITLQVKGMLG